MVKVIENPQYQRRIDLKRQFLKDWMTPYGLGLLEYRNLHGVHGDAAGNDNGILHSMYFYWVLEYWEILDEKDKQRFIATMKILERKESGNAIPGLYNRDWERNDRLEALDNYSAIASGSVLFEQMYALDIVHYGLSTGYNYNNVEPGVFLFRAWKQGSDIANYKINAGMVPTIWEHLWFVLGILFNAFQGFNAPGGPSNTSEHLMTWVRLKGSERKLGHLPKVYKVAFEVAKAVWLWRLKSKTKGKGIGAVLRRYIGERNPPNPLVELSDGVVY